MKAILIRIGALTLLSAIVAGAFASDAKESGILGNWLTEPKDGIIQISLTAPSIYEGRIVGGNRPGRLDEMNPDPAQRGRPLRGQIILRHLHYDGDGKWSD